MSRVRDRLTASLALRFTLLRTTGAYNAAVVSVAACPCRARTRYARSYVGIRGFPAESWVQVVNSPKADQRQITARSNADTRNSESGPVGGRCGGWMWLGTPLRPRRPCS